MISFCLSYKSDISKVGNHEAYSFQDQGYVPGTNLAVPNVFYCIIISNTATLSSLDPGMKLCVAKAVSTRTACCIAICWRRHGRLRFILAFNIAMTYLTFILEGKQANECISSINSDICLMLVIIAMLVYRKRFILMKSGNQSWLSLFLRITIFSAFRVIANRWVDNDPKYSYVF